MICPMANDPRLSNMCVKSQQQPSRDELDRHAIGSGREFYVQLAIAMVNEDYLSPDGNPVSLPDDPESDPTAPEDLLTGLASLDVIAPATSMRSCVEVDEDGNLLLKPVQDQLKEWMLEVKRKYTVRICGLVVDAMEGGNSSSRFTLS